MTVIVDLGAVFVNDAADPSDFARFDSPTGLVVTTSVRGDVRTMANGRTRVVTRAGTPRTAQVSLEYLTRPDVDWLESHVGDLLCFRDHLGRKFFGVYFDVPVTEVQYVSDRADLSLSLTEVTHSEAV